MKNSLDFFGTSDIVIYVTVRVLNGRSLDSNTNANGLVGTERRRKPNQSSDGSTATLTVG